MWYRANKCISGEHALHLVKTCTSFSLSAAPFSYWKKGGISIILNSLVPSHAHTSPPGATGHWLLLIRRKTGTRGLMVAEGLVRARVTLGILFYTHYHLFKILRNWGRSPKECGVVMNTGINWIHTYISTFLKFVFFSSCMMSS